MSVSVCVCVCVCVLRVCACAACVCMHVCVRAWGRVIKQNTRGHQRLCLSVCLSHSLTHSHTRAKAHARTVFPWRPSSSAIFTSDYTFHLLIFILICLSQTREGGKGSDRREREGGREREREMGEGGLACIRSAEKEGIWRREREWAISLYQTVDVLCTLRQNNR